MIPPTQRWIRVESALQGLGVRRRSGDIERIRTRFSEVAGRGHHLMPDFTLHDVTHSDNLILILADLKTKCDFTLRPYEAYLLAASAYLHDLGMFFSKHRYLRTIAPSLRDSLRFCPSDACDLIDYDQVRRKPLGQQIRLTHNVLTARWLADVEPSSFGIDRGDVPYIITVCRGHRKTNLRSKNCTCYQTRPVDGELLRIGLLTGLLRLADALDFCHNRAPGVAFEQSSFDFLNNPVALEHWIKHYFVTDPYVVRGDEGGNPYLECQLHVTVPMKSINSVPYQDFFRPLFQAHAQDAQAEDLDCDQYPPELAQALGITQMRIRLVEDRQVGFRDLPTEVLEDAQRSRCGNVMDFLDWLRGMLDEPEHNNLSLSYEGVERLSYGIIDLLNVASYSELGSKAMKLVSQMLNADSALYRFQTGNLESIGLATCVPEDFRSRLRVTYPYGEVPLIPDTLSRDHCYLLIEARGQQGELEGAVFVQRVAALRHTAEPFSEFDRRNLLVLATAIGHALQRLGRA